MKTAHHFLRPSLDETMLGIALQLSLRGTCGKMQVGCVFTDARGRILAATYNGPPSGMPHCRDTGGQHDRACAGRSAPPGSDLCEGVHAEQNALMQCREPDRIATAYLTISPCWRCVKEMLNTGCRRLVFLKEYDQEPQARDLWVRGGGGWHLGTLSPATLPGLGHIPD